MIDKKKILIFLDLEGTLIEEELGNLNEDKINGVLDSLSKLEEITNSELNIHIVSPVFIKTMEKVLDKLDRLIIRYNRANGKNLKEVQSAVAYPDIHYIDDNFLYDKIIPMKILSILKPEEQDRNGKFEYVRNWIESMQEKIAFCIYGGNGYNDTKAMEYIKRNKGFVICPENSWDGVKKIADHVSEEHAADGIKDGIDFINKQIEIRIQKQKEANTQGDDTEAR